MLVAAETPRISIVTPSYNQGVYIEETIRSILLQGYPDLEFIVLDGGSKDETVEIVRKYEQWIAHWESGPDGGQAEAINKGFRRITGTIANWVNSDDVLMPGALHRIASAFRGGPVVGSIIKGESYGQPGDEEGFPGISAEAILLQCTLPQPAIWMPVESMAKAGEILTKYDLSFDVDYLVRLFAVAPPPTFTNSPLVYFRLHDSSKTMTRPTGFELESRMIVREWCKSDRPELRRVAQGVRRKMMQHGILARLEGRRMGALRKLRFVAAVAAKYRRLDRFTLSALARALRG